ncbi:MAG: hypothetical protein HQ581_29185 [Planctomycetes bacterium]|nr:hypothetical protein [Planctomycetota bacterium]
MPQQEAIAATIPVVEAFARLGVRYYVGGSLASSAHGVPRSTLDADLVADLTLGQVSPLVAELCSEYYIHEPAVRDAVQRRASFNAIHLATSFKVDVFVVKDRPYDRLAMQRPEQIPLDPDVPSQTVFIASAEDTVLAKLEWYRLGDEVSERQWNDLTGVIKTQHEALDREYLKQWAGELKVADLLERAWRESQQ